MNFQIFKCPQCVFRCAAAEIVREGLAVRRKRQARENDQAVQGAPKRLGRHDKGDGQDPQGDPVVPPPEAHLDDSVSSVLVHRCVVHDDENRATLSRGVQCTLLVEESLHERRAREPVKEEPVVPVLPDDGDVVRLGPPAAADDEVGAGVRPQRCCLPEKVCAHVALPSFPGPRDHEDHRPPLHEGSQSPVPPRQHLFDDPVYISLR